MRQLLLVSSLLAVSLLGCEGNNPDSETLDDSADPLDIDSEDGMDGDGDGHGEVVDCDDDDAAVHPGAVERCNGVDDDCDEDTLDTGMVTVDGDATFATITEALGATSGDSVVMVCDGTYTEALVVLRSLTLRSLNGPAVTTIDAGGTGSVIRVAAGTLTVEGFTLTGGDAEGTTSSGGGINAWQSSGLVVSNSTLSGNAADLGGAIALGAVPATLTDVTLTGNVADRGGAVWVDGGALTCAGTTVASVNTATTGGGGLWLQGGATSAACSVQDNTASERGGGLYVVDGSTATGGAAFGNQATSGGGVYLRDAGLDGVTVQENQADYGGGIYVSGTGSATSTITGGDAASNLATESGAGIYALGDVTISGTAVLQNQSDNRGGGIYVSGATAAITATIGENGATLRGGGLYANNAAVVTLTGGEVADNTSERGAGLYLNGASTIAMTSTSVLRNGDGATTSGGGARVTDGQLTVTTSDWGADPDDNIPDDVYIEVGQTSFSVFAADASFSCDAVACAAAR